MIDTARGKIYNLAEIPNFSQLGDRSISILLTNNRISLLCLVDKNKQSGLFVYDLPVNLSEELTKWVMSKDANEKTENSERMLP